jgi:hypothetical protein
LAILTVLPPPGRVLHPAVTSAGDTHTIDAARVLGGAPSGFAKVAAPMMERAMKSAMGKDLARLAQRLENR